MMSTQQKTDVNVIAVENNSYSNAALDDEGRVWTWGNSNVAYRLGRASSGSSNKVNPYNRGCQVTTTIYAGEDLPFILQISGSYQNTLALDRAGNVWSWGQTTSGALGRTGGNALPGKVEFPAGVKIKWIAAAYHGGKVIDTDGNIWVWGEGTQFGLGTGSTTDLSTPVKLTLDSAGNPLPTNFVKISSSDFSGTAAAIAVTEDGKIFTWGNDDDASCGGSKRPKQAGTNADIKKICVGNGSYGFLTNSGEAWTWGDNTIGGGNGRLGHGDTLSLAAPKRIETVSNNGVQPAPKFRDFSIYAWSTCAVDYTGNIYGCGQNSNNKHTGAGTPTRLTKYLPNGLPSDTTIFIVAEGFTSTSYVDIYGNAYVTGESDARGDNNNDGSAKGPWVHFTGSGKPMFTLLSSSPTSEAKRYSTSPKTTLNIETNIAADEVKYVILYPEDTERYTDGETFYSKTFAEIEQPYYNKNTKPQLLLSPNYDLWSSRYYANPKISEEVFNAAFNMKSTPDKGSLDVVAGLGNKVFQRAELVSHNCVVWVQSKNTSGTTRAIYRFDNYYTQTKAWFEGVKLDDPTFNLYQPELVGGGYGLFLDQQGNLIPGKPPFGYDIVMPTPNNLAYWSLSPTSQVDEEVADDGLKHRVDRSKEIFLTELSQRGDDTTKTPRVTFTYEKNPLMWVAADLFFVNEAGNPVNVLIDGSPTPVSQEHREMFAPKGAEHVVGQDPYLPPEADNPLTKVVGYRVGTPPNGPGSYTECDFPSEFKAELDDITSIYIVYATGMVSVTETFIDITGEVEETPIKNNDGLFSSAKNLLQGIENYDYFGPAISGYVIVGHEIIIEGEGPDKTPYEWISGKYQPKKAFIPAIEGPATVKFLYKADNNGNNIPDDEEGSALVRWIAVGANNAAHLITEKTFIGNGKQGDYTTIRENQTTVLPAALYDPLKWIFRPGHPLDESPYSPAGSDGAETILFAVGPTKEVYFYYDEDYNENGHADKTEGHFTEKYKLSPLGGDLTPPKADVVSKWLGGQTYSREAPLIANYVSVGYVITVDGGLVDEVPRVNREQTGNVAVIYEIPLQGVGEAYTVTFLYKEDKNNNNIPDDEEGSVTIRWVGKTFAGNDVELGKLVLEGYVPDNVTDAIYPPNPIDDIWKLTDSDVPASVVLDYTPQYYEYQYIEVPEFATVIIEAKSTDGNLNFYYQYTKRLTDEAFDTTAFAIPTYRVAGYTLYDNYGTEIGSGTVDTVTINPSIGSQRVVFQYESTITTVVIRAVNIDDYSNIMPSQTITSAVIGQKYSAIAPYVDNTWVLTGDLLQVIDVAAGTNYITFEYEKATGNVTVLLKETDTSGPIIQVLSETVEQGTIREITIPELENAYYTQISQIKQFVDYTGADPEPQIVEYYYSKDMMDVAIKAVDESDNTVLKTVSYTAAARKGESYTGIAPAVEWYTLAESNSKTVYADPGAVDSTVIVNFAYKKDNIGNISVKSFYLDEDNNEVELEAYTAKSIVGNKFIAISNSFPGFKLVNEEAATAEIIVDTDESKNNITFVYERTSTTVAIYMINEDTSDYLAVFHHMATVGGSFTFNAPNIAGYYLTSASTIGSVSPVLPNDASEITFTYKKLTSKVTIVARENDASGEIIRVFPAAEATAEESAPNLSVDFYTTITPTVSIIYEGTGSVSAEAYYTKDLVDIPIKSVDCSTGSALVATPDTLANQRKGEAVTVSAPSVTDYVLIGDATQTVIADGNEVIFTFCHN